MSLSFNDIRLQTVKTQQDKDLRDTASKLVTEYCQLVFAQFEKETGLASKDHYHSILKTDYFNKYFQNVCVNYANVSFVIKEKSFFKDPIILVGTVFFNDKISGNFCLDNSTADYTTALQSFTSELSVNIAKLKGP